LNELKIEAEQLTQRFDQSGLPYSRDAFEQNVPPAENPDQDEPVQFGPSK
jgi:hypothetical protein